jgi:hypothetical protein
MTINLDKIFVFIWIIVFILTLYLFVFVNTWDTKLVNNIEDSPCSLITKAAVDGLGSVDYIVQLNDVEVFRQYKNVKCFGSVIEIIYRDPTYIIISGFNNRIFFIIGHFFPLIFFQLWLKKYLTTKNLILNIIFFNILFQTIFLYLNNLSVLNYFSLPYNILLFFLFSNYKESRHEK